MGVAMGKRELNSGAAHTNLASDAPVWGAADATRSVLFDAHCHIGFAGNALQLAQGLVKEGVSCFANTVLPDEYERLCCLLDVASAGCALRAAGGLGTESTLGIAGTADVSGAKDAGCVPDAASMMGVSGIFVGLGMHPWNLLDGSCTEADVRRFLQLVSQARFVGEVGLDFGRRFSQASPEHQHAMLDAFERAIWACASESSQVKVVSIHAVRAAGRVLDILEESGCAARCCCILHWFSGSSDELQRAVRMGCWFSAGPGMLASRRGREYVRAIPLERLLLETDEPSQPMECFEACTQAALLRSTQGMIAECRGMDPEDLAVQLARTAEHLFGKRAFAAKEQSVAPLKR